jgi:hypothetical protein
VTRLAVFAFRRDLRARAERRLLDADCWRAALRALGVRA